MATKTVEGTTGAKLADQEVFPLNPALLVWWLALCAAILELAYMAGLKLERHIIFNSLQVLWMTPLSYLLLFSPLAILVLILHRIRPAWRLLAPTLFVAVTLVAFSFFWLFSDRMGPVSTLLLTAGVAIQGSRLLRARSAGFARLIRRTLPWMIGSTLLVGVGLKGWAWFREYRALRAEAAAAAPNVLLIVLDTVRGMNMSLYGYARRTTPTLEAFARQGVLFQDVYAAASWTLPSIATVFTGEYPHAHRADWMRPLSDQYPTLAEVFRDAGYVTVGFAANESYASAEVGLARGFAHYEDYGTSISDIVLSSSPGRFILNNPKFRKAITFYDTFGRKNADRVNTAFLSWLSGHKRRPFFAFLNYFDVHEPYLPRTPFDTLFGSDSLRKKSLILHFGARQAKRLNKENMTESERAAEEEAYDGSLAYLDSQLGRLFAELERRDLVRNTIIIVTADHGELFGEHSLFSHGNSLYLPLLKVPLILRASNLPAGTRVAAPVTLRDLPRTILDLAGLPAAATFPGQSFKSLAEGHPDGGAGSPLLAEVGPSPNHPPSYPVFKGPMWSIIDPPHQYILRGDGEEELYDFVSDPGELVNLTAHPEASPVRNRMRSVLDSIRKP
jgi:arylsulfatase A-like enzyme